MNALRLRLANKNREVNPESWEKLRRNAIVRDIRQKVAPSVNEENAVLRKTLAQVIIMLIKNTDLTEEQALKVFAEFYDYNGKIEKCKADVKEELGIDQK
jgi:hypothetical protein